MREEGKQLIEEAMGQGITFIDTADSYGFGRSEELVGEVLKGKRHEVVLATKRWNTTVIKWRGLYE